MTKPKMIVMSDDFRPVDMYRQFFDDPVEQKSTRPPIGIEPEFIWKEKRLHALMQAASRYIDAGLRVKPKWFSEIRNLIDDLQTVKQDQEEQLMTEQQHENND